MERNKTHLTHFGSTAETVKLRGVCSVHVGISQFFSAPSMQIVSILEQLSSLLLLEKRVKPSTCPNEAESTVSF